MPPYFINITSIISKVTISVISFLNFPSPTALLEYLHGEAFTKLCSAIQCS